MADKINNLFEKVKNMKKKMKKNQVSNEKAKLFFILNVKKNDDTIEKISQAEQKNLEEYPQKQAAKETDSNVETPDPKKELAKLIKALNFAAFCTLFSIIFICNLTIWVMISQ
jgi:hypothetical protein